MKVVRTHGSTGTTAERSSPASGPQVERAERWNDRNDLFPQFSQDQNPFSSLTLARRQRFALLVPLPCPLHNRWHKRVPHFFIAQGGSRFILHPSAFILAES